VAGCDAGITDGRRSRRVLRAQKFP